MKDLYQRLQMCFDNADFVFVLKQLVILIVFLFLTGRFTYIAERIAPAQYWLIIFGIALAVAFYVTPGVFVEICASVIDLSRDRSGKKPDKDETKIKA